MSHTATSVWSIICGRSENSENGLAVGVQGHLDAYMGPLVNGRVALVLMLILLLLLLLAPQQGGG